MADKRLRGQEVQVQVLQDGSIVGAINAVVSFNDNALFEKSSQGYLGEITNRVDDIFNGYDLGMEMHVSSQGWMLLQASIKARAQRLQPNIVFNIITVQSYANGDTPSRVYADVAWGPMPMNVGGRGEFVSVSLDASCSDVVDNLDGIL